MPRPADPYEVEQQLEQALAEVTSAQERAILAAWATAWSEISADLFDTLLDLMAAGARITAATVVRSQRLASTLAAVADRLEDLLAATGVTITGDLEAVVDLGVEGVVELIDAQLDDSDDDEERPRFDPEARPPDRALEAIIERTTEQITSTLTPIADETYAVIQRELIRGVAVGDNPRETARRMVDRAEDHWNFGRARALNVARTETLDAYRAGAAACEEPHADILAGWVWLAHLGPRTCRSCLAMHGELFDLDVPGPNDHQQGRCSRCPVVRGEAGAPDLSWVPDADEHFASLTREQQVALLGRQGYRAWLNGDFPREVWTKTRSTDGWRDSQVPAAPGDAGAGAPPDRERGSVGDGDDRHLPVDEDFVYDGELRGRGTTAPLSYAELDALGIVAPADDPYRHFGDDERAIADWLHGRGVSVLSVADADDVGRTPDAVIVGSLVTVEFKTLQLATPVRIRNAATRARGQAQRVLVDGRSAGLDAATARAGLVRALGLVGEDLAELVLILSDGTSVGWRHA